MIAALHLGTTKIPYEVQSLFLKSFTLSVRASVGSQTITYPYLPFREVNACSRRVDRFLCQVRR